MIQSKESQPLDAYSLILATMPNLLLVTPTLVSYQVFLRELTERLIGMGWAVHVACSSTNYPGSQVRSEPAELHEIDLPRGVNLLSYWRAAGQLRKLVRAIRPDVVHAHLQPAVLAVALARRSDWPVTLGTFQGLVHTILPHGPKRWLYRQAEQWASRRLDQVWLLTADDLAAMPLPNVAQQVAPGFGANQRVFSPDRFSPDQRTARRQALGVRDDALVFTYVGRLTHFKGYPETARAALAITARYPNVEFILVGTADPRHPDGLQPDERQQLHENDRIHFVGWESDVASLLHASDCFVFPSAREGLAVCIMEALSMGVPVVTTSARGCRELVQHGHNGWIVERETNSLVRQLQAICNDPGERLRMAATARAEREKYSRERFIDEQIAIYQRLIR